MQVDIPDSKVYLLPYIQKDGIYKRLLDETPWKQREMNMYGKTILQPRMTAWYGDKAYSYSGIKNEPLPFTELLLDMKNQIEYFTQQEFNSVLLNYYRNGSDSIGFHSDNEPELGDNPYIVSLSFGTTRTLIFKHLRGEHSDCKVDLYNGSMLIMAGDTQKNWKHGINKTKDTGGRINLTFRKIM